MNDVTELTYRGSRQHMKKMTVENVVEMITSEEMNLAVQKFREHWRNSRLLKRKNMRRRLPHILFGGVFTKRGMPLYSGFVVMELHNLKNRWEMERIRKELATSPNVLLAMEGAIVEEHDVRGALYTSRRHGAPNTVMS